MKRGDPRCGKVLTLTRLRVLPPIPLHGWLRKHLGIEMVSRDRGGEYAEAVRRIAPPVQAADRFHLLKNLGDGVRGLAWSTIDRKAYVSVSGSYVAESLRRVSVSKTFTSASTTVGSNCVPTWHSNSRRAAFVDILRR